EGHVDHRPVSVQPDEPAAVHRPQESGAGGIIEGPPRRTAEQADSIPPEPGGARGPIFGGAQLWQSLTNWRQRCRGTSGGGRSGLRRATPSTQSLGIRCAGAACGSALADGVFSRGNSHSHWLRAPNPARSDLMPSVLLARLNAFACVMRCPSLSNPAARALASTLVTAWARSRALLAKNQ